MNSTEQKLFKELGIEKLEDFKDGTIFVLLGCEFGSEKLGTCSDYVYIKLGDKLLNHKGWMPLSNYNGIDKNFSQKNITRRDELVLEYEIKEIYTLDDDECGFTSLNFERIYEKIKSLIPIWHKTFFEVTALEVYDYFYNNFDIDIIIRNKEEEEE